MVKWDRIILYVSLHFIPFLLSSNGAVSCSHSHYAEIKVAPIQTMVTDCGFNFYKEALSSMEP